MSAIDDFVRERNAALCDLSKYESFCYKWNIPLPSDPESRRRAILKARTAIPAIPERLRREAKQQLKDVGSTSFDDGDLS